MLSHRALRATYNATRQTRNLICTCRRNISQVATPLYRTQLRTGTPQQYSRISSFHHNSISRAQAPTADALMENLNDLYATAKDEFEIAAEETEKKTVYAADDREAAKEALNLLKEAYKKAIKESSPEVAKDVQSRSGHRIRELENAVVAMEEMAMED